MTPRDVTERPHAPSGVAEFMSAHSNTPYITPSMAFYLWQWGSTGRRGQQLGHQILLFILFT